MEVCSVLMTRLTWDLNDPTCEILCIAIFIFLLAVVTYVMYVLKCKELKKAMQENDELNLKVTTLEASLNDHKSRENEILEGFKNRVHFTNGDLDGPTFSSLFSNMEIYPISITENLDMVDGSYSFFVDREKKCEFALQNGKRAVLKEIAEKLNDIGAIDFQSRYDMEREEYKVLGNCLVLVKKERVNYHD